MLCSFKNCSTSAENHEFDVANCRSTDDTAGLEPYDWPLDYGYHDYCSENDSSDIESSNDTVSLYSESNDEEDLEEEYLEDENEEEEEFLQQQGMGDKIKKAQQFYLEWRPLVFRNMLMQHPQLLISSLMSSFTNTELQMRFQRASIMFHHFPKEYLYNILFAFLNDQYPDYLFHFDIYIGGCLNTYRCFQASQNFIQTTHTFQDVQEPMQSTGSEIEDAFERLDITGTETKTLPNLNIVLLKSFLCSPVRFVLNEQSTLDVTKTMKLNYDITESDVPILQALEYMDPESLSLITQLPWRELKALNSIEENITPLDRLEMIWTQYCNRYSCHNIRSPIIIGVRFAPF